jgi:hypothetical protein
VDVILNRRLVRAPADVEGSGIICNGGDYDPDAVRYALAAYCKDDLLQAINRTIKSHCLFRSDSCIIDNQDCETNVDLDHAWQF